MLKIINNYPLKNITTLGIGGPAKFFVAVSSEAELKEAINYAKENKLEFLIIGGGSNLLVSDDGVDKLIIKNEMVDISTSKGLARSADGSLNDSQEGFLEVRVNSGTILQDLVDFTIQNGLSGLQKMTGIPGTVGGAIYGNAGAYGQTISDHLVEVTALDPATNQVVTLNKTECNFAYRDSLFKKNGHLILAVKFELEMTDSKTLAAESAEILSKRLVKYPKGIKCPGSFFKNIIADTLAPEILSNIPPEKIVYGKLPAGALLEEVGAKGDKLGDIEIATYHANLFLNSGNGTAKDFYNLAKKYVDLVNQKFGITLEPEVQLVSLPALLP